MNKLTAVLASIALTVAGVLAIGPAQAVTPASVTSLAAAPTVAQSTQSCTREPDGKCYWYNGYHFYPYDNPQLCLQNNIGVYWDIPTAAAGYVSGNSTVGMVNRRLNYTASCAASGYPNSRIITFTTYNAADGQCSKVTGDNNNGQWTANVIVWMNLTSTQPRCRDTAQHRNNTISATLGIALGLDNFSSSTNLTASVMNLYFANSYNWPGTDDRNALFWLY